MASSSDSSSDDSSVGETSAVARLRSSTRSYTKEPKFSARSPVDSKYIFSGEYDKWDEADNFLRAFVLGRNMGYLIAPEFLKFYEKKHLKYSWNLAKIYQKYQDEDGLSIRDHQASLAQFQNNIRALYSTFLSVFRKGTDSSILTKHKATLDGVLTWIDTHSKYDDKGAIAIAADNNNQIITQKYNKHFQGGVPAFLTRLSGAFSKLNALDDKDKTGQYPKYSDQHMI